jgi:DNA repair protein RadA/Sms
VARTNTRHVCQSCGATYPKWAGRCEACGEWNTLIEEVVDRPARTGLAKSRHIEMVPLSGVAPAPPRRMTGIAEFDRVIGGGLVSGSAILVGGDPGIGKSTLLLQVVGGVAAKMPCAYITGEEAVDQVRMRAARLGIAGAPLRLAAATNVRDIVATLDAPGAGDVVVIDSIQTMYLDALDSAPGSVSQVRASADEIIRVAKRRGFTVLLVGHVTKEGAIAGPRVLEHMVDTVLYFEGERGHQFRLLRAIKNRFGPTDEIGVFEMTDGGLQEVANPSAWFLSERRGNVSGATVFAGIEGTRPLLVEFQALIAPASFAAPRRAVVGWDSARLAMILAVLEARCGFSLSARDVYLNVAGGLKIAEPAADLAVAGALISAAMDRAAPADAVLFGEIGLSGEVRSVGRIDARLREAAKLGFKRAIMPPRPRTDRAAAGGGDIRIQEARHLRDLLDLLGWDEAVSGRALRRVEAG